MGDRFTFLTTEGNPGVLPYAGCNGFPRAFTDGTEFDPSKPRYGVVVTNYLQVIKWYWRVRKWSISSDLSYTFNPPPPENPDDPPGESVTYNFSDFTTIDPITTGAPIIRELDLVYGARMIGESVDTLTQFQLFGVIDWPDIQQIGDPTTAHFTTLDYSPALQIIGGLGSGLTFATYPIGTGSIPASIDGVPFTLYLQFNDPDGTYGGTYFTITPSEYWPYAKSNGDPLYDTTTGDVIT